ncbi:hypothetical protein Tco_1040311 [Tanacetum coccineum]
MLIPDAFVTNEIRAIDDYKEYETVFVAGKKRKQNSGETSSPRKSLKLIIKQKQVVEGGQDKESYASKFAASMLDNDADDSGNRHQGYMIKDIKRKCMTTNEFWKVHGKFDQVLHEIIPQIAERATNDFIEGNLKRVMTDTRKFEKSSTSNISCKDDDFHSQHHDDHQDDDAPPEGEKRVKRHKTSKSSKSARGSSSKRSAKESTTYVTKQQHQQQEWDAWEEEKLLMKMRMKATLNDMLSNQFRNAEEYAYHLEQATSFMENQIVWESRQEEIKQSIPKALFYYGPQRNLNEPLRYLYNKDLFFLKNGNTEEKKYIISLQKIHAEPFPEADLEEKMNRWVRKEFKYFNEDARLSIQHWKDSWHKRVYKQNQRKFKDNTKDYFSNNRITEFVRITTDQLYGLNFMDQIIVIRENDKPDRFSKADFWKKKVNYRERKLMNSLITFIRSHVIWERVYDFQLGIESYQIKIVKFCDATLERVLNEVKLRIFQNQFWKKPP